MVSDVLLARLEDAVDFEAVGVLDMLTSTCMSSKQVAISSHQRIASYPTR
jgi:hypothetical protein